MTILTVINVGLWSFILGTYFGYNLRESYRVTKGE